MGNWLALSRDDFRELLEGFPVRIRTNATAVVLEMLMRARQSEGSIGVQTLLRGDGIFGESEMSEACGITRNQLRTVMAAAKRLGFCRVSTSPQGSTYHIEAFDRYSPTRGGEQAAPPVPILQLVEEAPAKKKRKPDPWYDTMIEGWTAWTGHEPDRRIKGAFAKYRSTYGEADTLQALDEMILAGRRITGDHLSYFAKACKGITTRQREAATEPGTVDDLFRRMNS